MSKEIYLYSKDKKYKCAVELADSCDRFGCPDHSVIILTEERPDGTYIIAEARDRILETEKDKEIEILKELVMHKTYNRNAVEARLNYEQNQKAIEVLQEVKEKFGYKHNSQLVVSSKYLCDFIDNQIKQLKGEE